MDRVFATQELLKNVFSTMDAASNFNNALVCKKWSDPALDVLWEDVDDLHRLLNLLAPLKRASSARYEYSRMPAASDWVLFQRYAKRVRKLDYGVTAAPIGLSTSVFDCIAKTRLPSPILPNMHTLYWNGPIALSVMFMHPGVKCFIINLPDTIVVSSPSIFFDDIAGRMPYITHIDIRTTVPMYVLEDEAIRLLSALPKLRTIVFPPFFFTTRIAECLSSHSNLTSIGYQQSEEQGAGDPQDVMIFKPELSEGAFPSLGGIAMVATYSDTQRFLALLSAPSHLTQIHVESPTLDPLDMIKDFISVIAENLPHLKVLSLISPRKATGSDLSPMNRVLGRIDMETLNPLLSCSDLVQVNITHKYPLDLTQDDLEIIALYWSSLETLILNNEPLEPDLSLLTLEGLLPFAQYCPCLTTLGLFIDASEHIIPPFSSASPFPAFENLQRLCMGFSLITDAAHVAHFLSHILAGDCTVEGGATFEALEVDDIGNVIRARSDMWEATNRLLPLFVSARMEEHEMMRGMQSEFDNLVDFGEVG